MKATAVSVFKGAAVGVVAALPVWWLPSFLQLAISDYWLALMTVPPIILGGYVAARRTPRPILAGVLAGLLTMLVILAVTLTTEEFWVLPIMLLVGGVSAALGAYIAVLAGQSALDK